LNLVGLVKTVILKKSASRNLQFLTRMMQQQLLWLYQSSCLHV